MKNDHDIHEIIKQHPMVSRVDATFTQSDTDITVYFIDSTEPFPLTSLAGDSRLRRQLEYWRAFHG